MNSKDKEEVLKSKAEYEFEFVHTADYLVGRDECPEAVITLNNKPRYHVVAIKKGTHGWVIWNVSPEQRVEEASLFLEFGHVKILTKLGFSKKRGK